jgi:hypothetical protein
MRSYEYPEASGFRGTKTVRIGDIVFRLDGEPIQSTDESALAKADTVSSLTGRMRMTTVEYPYAASNEGETGDAP